MLYIPFWNGYFKVEGTKEFYNPCSIEILHAFVCVYISHIQITSCAQIKIYISIYTSYELSAVNSVTKEHRYIYISHYWHMRLNRYPCHTACICSTALLPWSLHTDPTLLHTLVKKTNCYFNFSGYCDICYSNKKAPQISHLCNMHNLLDVHRWGRRMPEYIP